MGDGGGTRVRAGRRGGSASNEDRVEGPGRTSGARTLILIVHSSSGHGVTAALPGTFDPNALGFRQRGRTKACDAL